MCDTGSVRLGAHREHMQLVQLGNLLQEETGVRPQPAMIDHRVARQIEAIHILGGERQYCNLLSNGTDGN